MQVEDHPIDYNRFEGTIPKGEYGGGTVMLWDTGTYTADQATGEKDESAVRDGYERGDLKITFHGKRMHGSYALIRTKGMWGSKSSKPSWLLIKHRDSYVRPEDDDIVQAHMTSVISGRTMEEIRDVPVSAGAVIPAKSALWGIDYAGNQQGTSCYGSVIGTVLKTKV